MKHDKAIEAAWAALPEGVIGLVEQDMRRIIAAFLRAWEPTGDVLAWDIDGTIHRFPRGYVRSVMSGTADELEGGT